MRHRSPANHSVLLLVNISANSRFTPPSSIYRVSRGPRDIGEGLARAPRLRDALRLNSTCTNGYCGTLRRPLDRNFGFVFVPEHVKGGGVWCVGLPIVSFATTKVIWSPVFVRNSSFVRRVDGLCHCACRDCRNGKSRVRLIRALRP